MARPTAADHGQPQSGGARLLAKLLQPASYSSRPAGRPASYRDFFYMPGRAAHVKKHSACASKESYTDIHKKQKLENKLKSIQMGWEMVGEGFLTHLEGRNFMETMISVSVEQIGFYFRSN